MRNAKTINRLSDWIDHLKDAVGQFLGIVYVVWWLVWALIVLARVPEVYGHMLKVMNTEEVASVKKPVSRKHSSFIPEAVARRYGPPMQYPKQ